jgi:integrase
MSRDELPRSVFAKGRRYYLVTADGKKRIWHRLSRIDAGLAALYAALAEKKRELELAALRDGKMPALIGDWENEELPRLQRQTMPRHYNKGIAEAFKLWLPEQMDTPGCAEFLKQFRATPRTYNANRSQLRELMRFAELKGRRPAGSNPVDAIRTMRTPARKRCPSSSEIRRVKIGCLYGRDGKRTPSGMMMACLIEMLYLTGQDVGVVVRVLDARDALQPDEPHCREDGIFFRRDKTGNAVVIGWTPRLEAVVARLRALKAERMLLKKASQRVVTPCLFTNTRGFAMTYEAAANAWQDGIKRAGVLHFMLRDIRAAALTDKEDASDMREANAMGAHATESQTADYVRRRRARKTSATR